MGTSPDRLTAALADRYTIEEELGAGGMATVYLAHDIKHDRKVAVKVLRPELAAVLGGDRFLQEIKVTANLQHPHVLPLYDSGEADSFLYYVMPYVEGESLRDLLRRETQLSLDESVRLTTQVASALDYAHRHKVVHRDIKPENILIHDGQALVADFGIALAVRAAGGTRLTETGLSLGTPHYMSPEQATADRELDARSDIYSLACVAYEMLIGEPPYTGPNAQAVLVKVMTEEPRRITDQRKTVPRHVEAAIHHALEKLPADRFDSAADFAEALETPGAAAMTATAASTGAATPAAERVAFPPWRRDRRLLVTAAALLVTFALALFFALRSPSPPVDVARFTLWTPEGRGVRLRPNGPSPIAISPDGQSIVYESADAGGQLQLLLRRLDQLEATPIQGTEGGASPFFSPDGVWVGFRVGRTLQKVPLNGGPPITLADSVNGALGSGTWGDDGHIVYTGVGRRLLRVNAGGGTSELLFGPPDYPDIPFWPSYLPGGHAVLFERCSPGCSETALAVLDLETREVRDLVPGASAGWYVATGHIVFTRQPGSVFAAPFDLDRLEVTGPPFPLFDDVHIGVVGGSQLAVSSQGSLVYVAGAASGSTQLVLVERNGSERLLLSQDVVMREPRLSPSGDRVAFAMPASGGGQQIWIYDIASETTSQLTFEGISGRSTWSPDGTRLAYASDRDGPWELFGQPADGSGTAERIAATDLSSFTAITSFWSRDGKWMVADFPPEAGGSDDIFAIPLDGDGEPVVVVSGPTQESVPALSPDGQWLAYTSEESGVEHVYVRPFPGPGGRWPISTSGGTTPLWASNTELIYASQGDMELAVLEFGTAVRVTERQTLFSLDDYLPGDAAPPFDISRDGQRFLMVRRELGDQRDPIVVLNWFEEIRQRVRDQGGRRP